MTVLPRFVSGLQARPMGGYVHNQCLIRTITLPFEGRERTDDPIHPLVPEWRLAKSRELGSEPVVDVARRIVAARAVEVEHYAKLYPLLLAEMDEIMADWDRQTDALPWSALETSERQNDLAGVVTRVIDCAMSPAPRAERVDAMIAAACRHGQYRRRQGVDVHSIFTEYDVVRSATWRQLKALVSAPTSYDAIFVIDGLLSVATRGTVLGFHREEMEANGLFAKHLLELKKTVRS